MAKKKYLRLAKWVIKEATTLKQLLTKKQIKKLKKAKSIEVDAIDGCLYAIIGGGNTAYHKAQYLIEKATPRRFDAIENIRKKDSTKDGEGYSCIEAALNYMPQKDIQSLIDFLLDRQYSLILTPNEWKYGKHGSIFTIN